LQPLPRAQCPDDLVIGWKAALVVLGEDDLAVDADVEDAAIAAGQLRVDAQLALDRGRQTGGPWEVVSARAVGDRQLHPRMVAQTSHEPPVRAQASPADTSSSK
jgi:hypothetical protein